MSKKKFTEGMESLFGESAEETLQEELKLFPEAKQKPKRSKKSSSGKDFSADLQSFLTEAFEESFEEQLARKEDERAPMDKRVKKRYRKPLSGLDALIRSTVDPDKVHITDKPTRRITLVFDKTKLEKLKTIARQEKTYLREIIDEIVGAYLEDYEQKKSK